MRSPRPSDVTRLSFRRQGSHHWRRWIECVPNYYSTQRPHPVAVWYVLVESAKCLDLAQLFAALATALAIPADRFISDKCESPHLRLCV